ncbi:MAG: SIS domain-containing protein [Acidobacteriota bacterium]
MSLQQNRQQVFGSAAAFPGILHEPAGLARLLAERHRGQTVVFTNGCFDLIHRGHVEYLERARELGDALVVGLNSDESVRRIKGPERPLVPLADRAAVVAALAAVDYVTSFDEPTPLELIRSLPVQVLVKGGDWPEELVVGGDVVRQRGGRVVCLGSGAPDLSTSALVARIRGETAPTPDLREADGPLGVLAGEVGHCLDVHGQILERCGEAFARASELLGRALRGGGCVYAFGNGGSAADAQHFAAELVGRFRADRGPLPAASLVTDSSVLTALGNDFGFEEIFARQVAARVRPGDVALGISTSGGSRNVLNGLMRARELGARTIGLTGERGRQMAGICDVAILVPSTDTARIQEVHSLLLHSLVEALERGRE